MGYENCGTFKRDIISVEKLMEKSGVATYVTEKTRFEDEVLIHFMCNDIEYSLKVINKSNTTQYFLLYRKLNEQYKWLLADTNNWLYIAKRITEDLEFVKALREA